MNRRHRALQIFGQAFDMLPEDRDEFLDRACGNDGLMRAKVDALLWASAERAENLLATQACKEDSPAEPSSLFRSDSQRLQCGNKLFNRYEVAEQIGVGGMGEVYRAIDHKFDRSVAIKVIKSVNLQSSDVLNRFDREIKSVASLSHPCIVSLFDTCTDGDIHFAVMEFVPGVALRTMMHQPIASSVALRVAHQVAMGLNAAHSHGIMHRDIKPENIIVGQDGHTKVLDFGLARPTSLSADQEVTTGGVLPGTVPYMSPEQIMGMELTCATDIFSLGTVLFEMLTGVNPFRGESALETMQRIKSASIPSADSAEVSVPSEVAALLASMLDAKPENRPSAASLVDSIGNLLKAFPGRDTEGAPDTHNEERVLRNLLDGVSDAVGVSFFRALVKSLAEALGAYSAMVTEFDRQTRRARALAFWTSDGWVDGYEYTIAGTPCESVFETQKLYHHPDGLQELFPDDHDLPEMGLVSYLGVPLFDSDGTVLGNLAVIDNKAMPREPQCIGLMRLFATRASAEHQRLMRERDQQERELKLVRLLDGVADAIVEIDEALTITQFNRSAEVIFGLSANHALGRQLSELLESPDEDGLREILDSRHGQSDSSVAIPGGLRTRSSDVTHRLTDVSISSVETAKGVFFTIMIRNSGDYTKNEAIRGKVRMLRTEIDEVVSEKLIGESPEFEKVLRAIQLVSSTDATVLVCGATGTGKEVVARAIHASSRRNQNPLVVVNCATILSGMAEQEFFGDAVDFHADTNAASVGRFLEADRGTIVLDEISELPLDMQGRLLEVLENGQFRASGDSATTNVDVRVIALTKSDLEVEIAAGRFRQDLYYRLNVFPIDLPPLRERGDDVILLANSFMQEMDRSMQRGVTGLSENCKAKLRAYHWPGNVRELRNIVERALITATSDRLDLSGAFRNGVSPRSFRQALTSADPKTRVITEEELCDLERRNILQALKVCDWKISDSDGAAELLGMAPSKLDARIKDLGICKSK